jgi:hypothetical protein
MYCQKVTIMKLMNVVVVVSGSVFNLVLCLNVIKRIDLNSLSANETLLFLFEKIDKLRNLLVL